MINDLKEVGTTYKGLTGNMVKEFALLLEKIETELIEIKPKDSSTNTKYEVCETIAYEIAMYMERNKSWIIKIANKTTGKRKLRMMGIARNDRRI